MRSFPSSRALIVAVALVAAVAGTAFAQRPPRRGPMGLMGEGEFGQTLTNWFIQESAKVAASGDQVSAPGLAMNRWFPATVPATVMGTLVQNNVYTDIYVGDNLKRISPEPFQGSWWYRTEFPLTADPSKTTFKLQFDGINYRANVWLNGKKIADASEAYGAFRRLEFDITTAAVRGGQNVLAVEIFPPRPGEPTMGFVDWNPAPPDKNMGIWREVRVKATGDVSIDAPFVMTKLDLRDFKEASLTVSAELRNNGANEVSGTLEGRLESRTFSREVTLAPKEAKKIVFAPESTPELVLKNPRVWWTHDLGKPELYVLGLTFKPKGPAKIDAAAAEPIKPLDKLDEENKGKDKDKESPWTDAKKRPGLRGMFSDLAIVRFGVREVSDAINEQGWRGFKLNGKKILIRGGGWTDDLLLDNRPSKVAAEVAYARHMNLNAIRVEGFWGSGSLLYDLCDQNGILVMAGWSCQWEWEHYFGKPVDEKYGGIVSPEDVKLVAASWRGQVRWLRNHPSIFVWMEASDLLPKPELEKEYIAILKEDDPTRPAVVSAKEQTSELSGKSAVKMRGPYDWVPPTYWYVDQKNGGAFGFNTETGPGPQVPPIESLRKMIPEKNLWPIDDIWYYHCCRGKFNTLDTYNQAMTKRLGAPKDLTDYLAKAQYLNYEAMRGMFEAFVANKHTATGVIQWMYNSAWPKLWWQLYDYFLMPNGAFYGARKAGTPLHLIYDYGAGSVLAVNNTLEPADGLKAVIRVFDIGLNEKYSREVPVALAADEVKRLDVALPREGFEKAWFLDLRLYAKNKDAATVNFYALSPKPEIMDDAGALWYLTPVKEFADLTALQELPPVTIREKHSFKKDGLGQVVTVELENPTPSLAFQVEINVYKGDSGDIVVPVFWDDNFVSLLPGEKRKIRGFFALEDLGGAEPELKIRGWNIN
jgi:exo-1,4-beta-D-glucosaminidase